MLDQFNFNQLKKMGLTYCAKHLEQHAYRNRELSAEIVDLKDEVALLKSKFNPQHFQTLKDFVAHQSTFISEQSKFVTKALL